MKKTPPVSTKTIQSVDNKSDAHNSKPLRHKPNVTQSVLYSPKIKADKTLEDNALSTYTYSICGDNHTITINQSANPFQVIYGQIIEIDTDKIILRCLIDEDEKLFQKRSFNRQLLEGAVNLSINQFVEMKIFTLSGGLTFLFSNANQEDLADKFTPKDYFSQFTHSALFQPLPLNIDADNF